jgi:hypothetical protein
MPHLYKLLFLKRLPYQLRSHAGAFLVEVVAPKYAVNPNFPCLIHFYNLNSVRLKFFGKTG